MAETKDRIVDTATRMIRTGGYNAFSFREIADEIGIKSSSVHHYFRRKENLAEMVARAYEEGFFGVLGDPERSGETVKDKLDRYVEAFAGAFRESGKACLCGILTHESPALPESVVKAVKRFVDRNVLWLEKAIESVEGEKPKNGKGFAKMVYCTLEGAMGVATLEGDEEWVLEMGRMLVNVEW